MKSCVSFDDVLLVPRYSDIHSRKEISLSAELSSHISLDLPIISSPMDTVTEYRMAASISEAGGMGIIHRYNSITDQAELIRKACENGATSVGAAIGVSGNYVERARVALSAGANVLCVDIAHGHHALMRNALQVLRNTFGYDIHVMAGNVATQEGYEALANWGANSIRVGIGGGSICSTRIQTGHGMPTLQSIIECAQSEYAGDHPIIADGGIKNAGDIVKALAAGADFVMLGSLLAGTPESPGEIMYQSGSQCKVYRGMASADAQINWRGHVSSTEGVTSTIPLKGSVADVLKELAVNVKSGLSYSGAFNISELHSVSRFVKQTTAGAAESTTHIFQRN
ncbi:MAG TPA: guanosine monophosphate reductase [Flavobacteriales bacterium]|nr:guanosine monophosphate reductase [Flavobacteriales bacterium]